MKRGFVWLLSILTAIVIVGGWIWISSTRDESVAAQSKPIHATLPPALPTKKTPLVSFDPRPPKYIRIPSIGVAAPVIAVGKEPSGAMKAPDDNHSVGWYEYGYLPGAPGNAVLAGHFGDSRDIGVFRSLQKLKLHDSIQITTATRRMRFEVQKKTTYSPDAGRRKELFGKSKYAQLQLITCEGAWVPTRNSYAKRLVVTARFVSEKTL